MALAFGINKHTALPCLGGTDLGALEEPQSPGVGRRLLWTHSSGTQLLVIIPEAGHEAPAPCPQSSSGAVGMRAAPRQWQCPLPAISPVPLFPWQSLAFPAALNVDFSTLSIEIHGTKQKRRIRQCVCGVSHSFRLIYGAPRPAQKPRLEPFWVGFYFIHVSWRLHRVYNPSPAKPSSRPSCVSHRSHGHQATAPPGGRACQRWHFSLGMRNSRHTS